MSREWGSRAASEPLGSAGPFGRAEVTCAHMVVRRHGRSHHHRRNGPFTSRWPDGLTLCIRVALAEYSYMCMLIELNVCCRHLKHVPCAWRRSVVCSASAERRTRNRYFTSIRELTGTHLLMVVSAKITNWYLVLAQLLTATLDQLTVHRLVILIYSQLIHMITYPVPDSQSPAAPPLIIILYHLRLHLRHYRFLK